MPQYYDGERPNTGTGAGTGWIRALSVICGGTDLIVGTGKDIVIDISISMGNISCQLA